MDDLISRRNTLQLFETAFENNWTVSDMMDALGKLQPAQPERCEDCVNFSKTRLLIPQPEIIRCKDCRHRDPEDHKCDSGEMERQGCPFKVADDYFCAYGER